MVSAELQDGGRRVGGEGGGILTLGQSWLQGWPVLAVHVVCVNKPKEAYMSGVNIWAGIIRFHST